MNRNIILPLSIVLIFLAGCSKEASQVQTPKKNDVIPMSKKSVKKAPKISVKKRTYKNTNIKYRDTSESSKVRRYNPQTKKIIAVSEKTEKIPASEGGKLFYKKGCTLCHKKSEFRIGPSLRKLARGYKNKKSELLLYLQRKGEAIVYPDRSSIMRSQLTKLTIMSPKQYNDLTDYILNGGK